MFFIHIPASADRQVSRNSSAVCNLMHSVADMYAVWCSVFNCRLDRLAPTPVDIVDSPSKAQVRPHRSFGRINTKRFNANTPVCNDAFDASLTAQPVRGYRRQTTGRATCKRREHQPSRANTLRKFIQMKPNSSVCAGRKHASWQGLRTMFKATAR